MAFPDNRALSTALSETPADATARVQRVVNRGTGLE